MWLGQLIDIYSSTKNIIYCKKDTTRKHHRCLERQATVMALTRISNNLLLDLGADLLEGLDALVEVLVLVGGADLHADAGLAFRHDGIVEACDEDALFLHLGSILLALGGVVDHDGADGALAGLAVEALLFHAAQEVVGVLVQLVLQGVGLAHELEHADAGGHEAGSHGVAEQIGTAALTQHVDDFLLAGGEAAHGAAEGFAEGAGEDLNLAAQVVALGDAAAGLADHAGAVALVDHHHGVVLVGQLVDLVQRADVAVHREDAVGDDDAEAVLLGGLELLLEVGHVGVGVAVALGLAEADAVDDGGVVEGVADDGVLFGEQGFEHAAVGVEAGGVEDGVLGAEELGDLLLELLMQVLAAADEADRGHTEATGIHALLGGGDKLRVVGQTQVVVGAEVEALLALHHDLGTLGALDDAFMLVKTGSFDVGQLFLKMLLKFSVHNYNILRYTITFGQPFLWPTKLQK